MLHLVRLSGGARKEFDYAHPPLEILRRPPTRGRAVGALGPGCNLGLPHPLLPSTQVPGRIQSTRVHEVPQRSEVESTRVQRHDGGDTHTTRKPM